MPGGCFLPIGLDPQGPAAPVRDDVQRQPQPRQRDRLCRPLRERAGLLARLTRRSSPPCAGRAGTSASGSAASTLSSRAEGSSPCCSRRSTRGWGRTGQMRRPRRRGARTRDRRAGRGGALARVRGKAALPARGRHPDRVRARRRDRRLRPLPEGRGVHGLHRAGALRALLRRATSAGLDHEGRQRPRAPAVGRGRLARALPAEGRVRARPSPARPGRPRRRARHPLLETTTKPINPSRAS
jgi:hypothetical protein